MLGSPFCACDEVIDEVRLGRHFTQRAVLTERLVVRGRMRGSACLNSSSAASVKKCDCVDVRE